MHIHSQVVLEVWQVAGGSGSPGQSSQLILRWEMEELIECAPHTSKTEIQGCPHFQGQDVVEGRHRAANCPKVNSKDVLKDRKGEPHLVL